MTENHYQRPVEQPQEKAGHFGPTLTHPAYGQISASRVNGRAMLYGSDFEHDGYVQIVITRSELNRDGVREWPNSRAELISVNLSAAQWARFVSDMNRGDATQCTIDHVKREDMPGLPPPPDRKALYASHSAETAARVKEELAGVREALLASGMPAKRMKPLLDRIHQAEMAAGVNQEYVSEQFARHMESTTQKAAIEVNAMITAAVERAGLGVLQGGIGAPFLAGPGAAMVMNVMPHTPESGEPS